MEPLTILSAIATGIKLLKLAADSAIAVKGYGVKYKGLGTQLLQYRKTAARCNVRLDTWFRTWTIENTVERSCRVKRWGIDGWEVVEDELSSIDELCGDLMGLLAPFDLENRVQPYLEAIRERRDKRALVQSPNKLKKAPPPGVKAKSDTLQALPPAQREAVIRRKDEKKAIADAITVKDKLDLVFGASDDILKVCVDLEARIDSLEHISEGLFFARYTDLKTSASVFDRQHAVESRYRQELLEHAEELRRAATVLYQTCSSRNALDIRLPIEELPIEDLENHNSVYRVVYDPTTRQAQEFRVQVLQHDPPLDEMCQSFEEACEAAIQKVAHFACNEASGNAQYFALRITPKEFRLRNQTLATLLVETSRKARDMDKYAQFPIHEREALSYLLAQFAFLLLGTTWLSQLSSVNLSRVNEEKAAAYLLRILDSEGQRNDLLSKLKLASDEGYLDLQCWSLGILLVEIRLAVKVEDFIERDGRIMLVISDKSEIEIDGIELQRRCGPTLNTAITHCFHPKTTLSRQDLTQEECRRMLKTLYKNVLLPLQKEFERGKARRERSRRFI